MIPRSITFTRCSFASVQVMAARFFLAESLVPENYEMRYVSDEAMHQVRGFVDGWSSQCRRI